MMLPAYVFLATFAPRVPLKLVPKIVMAETHPSQIAADLHYNSTVEKKWLGKGSEQTILTE